MAKDKQKKAKGAPADDGTARLASHPRASRDVLRARGWGGLAGFVLAAWLSFSAGAPLEAVAARALVGGTVGALACWLIAVVVWRSLASAEIRAAHRALERAMAEAQQQAEQQRLTA
jgi:uncharacterized membrane protein YccC